MFTKTFAIIISCILFSLCLTPILSADEPYTFYWPGTTQKKFEKTKYHLIEWYENGQKNYEYFYDDEGKKTGTQKQWYPDGTLQLELHYCKGLEQGEFRTWHANGKIKLKWHYKNGRKHGVCIKKDKDGNLVYKKQYKNGKLKKSK